VDHGAISSLPYAQQQPSHLAVADLQPPCGCDLRQMQLIYFV
jgi:hypothetical protein